MSFFIAKDSFDFLNGVTIEIKKMVSENCFLLILTKNTIAVVEKVLMFKLIIKNK